MAPVQSAADETDNLPELAALLHILRTGERWLESRVLERVRVPGGQTYPVCAVLCGNPNPGLPVVAYFGGVHGVERIGAQVVVAFLQALVARLEWDALLHEQLARVRLLFIPIVNPGGMRMGRRSNPQGVDLMRNAPVEADQEVPPLIGGHRWTPQLPWYRGMRGLPMELESQALCDFVRQEMLGRPLSIALDCHSGFGTTDRIWFPFAYTRQPFSLAGEVLALKELFESANPHSRYIFEPQSRQYLTHGDLWDHLFMESQQQTGGRFLPLTLEMGSWLWVKKNPRQLFSMSGLFNPLIEHRQRRVVRQHQPLLDFLPRAAASYSAWLPTAGARASRYQEALKEWY